MTSRRAALVRALLLTILCIVPDRTAGADELPAWVSRVGARRRPAATRVCSANAYGASADTLVKSTAAIQRAIDDCSAKGGGAVTFARGGYVTGALFVKHDVELRVDSGVTLLGSQDDADYPVLPTRVAGIEMPWPAALVNVNGERNVAVTGRGTIDGRGQKWWDKYWTMRRTDYEPRGLRWAVDYDAQRVRLVVVSNASDVTIENVSLKRSGFWTVQLLYSDHVTVDGITISDNGGPSTDGVDIDSSRWILVQRTDISNNDDTICLKAGRDADGLRVNRPTEYVVIRDNVMRKGAGVVSFGSETSGSIRHVVALHNRANGTNAGLVFKSARTRGGVVENVLVRGLTLENVPTAFSFTLDWNPSYSYATLPKDTTHIPAHWRVLATPVTPPERGLAEFRDITIEDVTVSGARRIFQAAGLPTKPLHDVRWRNVVAEGQEAGSIDWARDWTMTDVTLRTPDSLRVTHAERVETPFRAGVLRKPVPDKVVVLTFDDAVASHATFVAPLLHRYGFGATFFVTEFRDPPFADKSLYMSWEQIRALNQMGFEIGNHTAKHTHVDHMTRAQLVHELRFVERTGAALGVPKPLSFAYPAYVTDTSALRSLSDEGYVFARTGGARAYDPLRDDPLLVPSFSTSGDDRAPIERALAEARGGKVVVFTIHGVPDTAHPWVTTSPALFEWLLRRLHDDHYTVLALRDLAQYVDPIRARAKSSQTSP
jgi:peptidoglycan/xylan/chitin deacetylase (PgdA/CDA1 family)